MRDEAFFSIYYECLFSEEDSIDEYGYRNLITNEELNKSFIDDIGIGRGVADRLKELDFNVKGVVAGGEPKEKTKFMNAKAKGY